MADRPNIAPKQRIKFGMTTAVVCFVYDDSTHRDDLDDIHGDCLVVYLEEGEAFYISVKWTGSSWEVANKNEVGQRANRRPDLRCFVDILRGRHS